MPQIDWAWALRPELEANANPIYSGFVSSGLETSRCAGNCEVELLACPPKPNANPHRIRNKDESHPPT